MVRKTVSLAFACVLTFSLSAEDVPKAFEIALDPERDFIKDHRESSAAPVLGYAGSMLEYPDTMLQSFFITNRAETAKMMRMAGAKLVKEWNAVERWQAGLAYANAKNDAERAKLRKRFGREGLLADPKEWFTFRKENGMKVLLCLELHRVWPDPITSTSYTGDIEIIKDTVCAYLKWIIDNGFKDQVAGFELGNEPYWGKDPEAYGARWCEIVPAMKKIWPDVKIGMPIAEYVPNDPDIAAVRARCEDMTWCKVQGQFEFSRLNQWSGRFIVAMKPVLDDITHVIYHFYGANPSYGCSMSGIHRIARFAKVYPEIKDKKVWITEWRERADENNRIHQRFVSALWKAHYMLMILTRPEIDGISNHCIASLAGGLYVSDGKRWRVQWDGSNRDYLDLSDAGRPHMELGPSGALFRLYTDALIAHPIVINSGVDQNQGLISKQGVLFNEYKGGWLSALYWDGRESGAQWVAATNPERTSLVILCVNTHKKPAAFSLNLKNFAVAGDAVVKETVCIPGRGGHMSIPGEAKPWRNSRRTVKVGKGGTFVWAMVNGSYSIVTIPLKKKIGATPQPSNDEIAAALADAAAVKPPAPPVNKEGAVSSSIKIFPKELKADVDKADSLAKTFAVDGAAAIGRKGAENDLERWVRTAVAYGAIPVCESDAKHEVKNFKYLALMSANKRYVVLLVVNSGDKPVKGVVEIKGFNCNECVAVREARRGTDGKVDLDCREEKVAANGFFVSSPHSFMTITIPVKEKKK